MMNRFTYQVLFIVLLACLPGWGQQMSISGTVTDSLNQDRIVDVNVFIQGSGQGSTTDQRGRYTLDPGFETHPDEVVIFKHVAYEEKQIPLGELRLGPDIQLLPIVIQMDKVDVESEAYHSVLDEGLANTKAVFTDEEIQVRAVRDISDLLKNEPSIQIEENSSGGRYISLRGSNVNDVTILFNGIRVNSHYDGSYDASFLDPDQINQIEIIKGGNLVLYGNQGMSGVVNILPKFRREYNAKFSQRFGSNNMGSWSLIGGGHAKGTDLYGTFTESASLSKITNAAYDSLEMELGQRANSKHFESSILIPLQRRTLKMEMYITDGTSTFENALNQESVERNRTLSFVNLGGAITADLYTRIGYSLGQESTQENYDFYSRKYEREIRELDHQVNLSADLTTGFGVLYGAYQFAQSHFLIEDQSAVGSATYDDRALGLSRNLSGYGLQFRSYDNSNDENETFLIDLGFRRDVVADEIGKDECLNCLSTPDTVKEGQWSVPSFRSAVFYETIRPTFVLNAHASFGVNKRYPYVLEIISKPLGEANGSSIELGRAFDLGFSVNSTQALANSPISSWTVASSFFWNHFTDKHVLITSFGVPLRSYFVVPDVSIYGLEAGLSIGLLDDHIFMNSSLLNNNISDLSAFPFKPEYKISSNLTFRSKYLGLIIENVREGARESWIRDSFGQFQVQQLGAWNSYDLHLTMNAFLMSLKGKAVLSYYNILDQRFDIQGLSYYQQRLMLSFNLEL